MTIFITAEFSTWAQVRDMLKDLPPGARYFCIERDAELDKYKVDLVTQDRDLVPTLQQVIVHNYGKVLYAA
jgi:hypothetical protein